VGGEVGVIGLGEALEMDVVDVEGEEMKVEVEIKDKHSWETVKVEGVGLELDIRVPI